MHEYSDTNYDLNKGLSNSMINSTDYLKVKSFIDNIKKERELKDIINKDYNKPSESNTFNYSTNNNYPESNEVYSNNNNQGSLKTFENVREIKLY